MEKEAQIEKIQNYITKLAGKFADHLMHDHQGLVAVSCHRCISFSGMLESCRWNLYDLENRPVLAILEKVEVSKL